MVDIDECANPNTNSCEQNCINIPGSYNCSCPQGYTGDGKKNGRGCNAIISNSEFPWIKFSVGKFLIMKEFFEFKLCIVVSQKEVFIFDMPQSQENFLQHFIIEYFFQRFSTNCVYQKEFDTPSVSQRIT